jgi:hypothetical protein
MDRDERVSFTTGSLAVSVAWNTCQWATANVWLAYQDGDGPWTVPALANGSYQFTLSSGRGGVVTAGTDSIVGSYIFLLYGSAQELAQIAPSVPCITDTKQVHGNVAGLDTQHFGDIVLGNQPAVSQSDGPLNWPTVAPGVVNLVGVRFARGPDQDQHVLDRMIIRRDLTPGPGSTLAPVDFNGSESFAPASGHLMATGFGAGMVKAYSTYLADSTNAAPLSWTRSLLPASYAGVPPGHQRAGELHAVFLCSDDVVNGPLTFWRCAGGYFAAVGDRTLDATFLPESEPSVTLRASGPYPRPAATLTSTANAAHFVFAQQGAPNGSTIVVWMSRAYVNGGASWQFELPDFTGLPGWNAAWAPAQVNYWSVDAEQWNNSAGGFFETPGDETMEQSLNWVSSSQPTPATSRATDSPMILPRRFLGRFGRPTLFPSAATRGLLPGSR